MVIFMIMTNCNKNQKNLILPIILLIGFLTLLPCKDCFAKESDQLQNAVTSMSSLLSSESSDHKAMINELYDQILAEIDELSTERSLNLLNYYHDISDDSYAALDLQLTMKLNENADAACCVIKRALKHPTYQTSLSAHIGDDRIISQFLSYQPMTNDVKALLQKETALIQQYDKLSLSEFSDEKAQNCAEIFQELITVRNELAAQYGYSDYATYAHAEIYNRDYTKQALQTVYKDTKTYVVPLAQYLYTMISSCEPVTFTIDDTAPEEMPILLTSLFSDKSESLKAAWQYLLDNKLYDLSYSPNKMDIGYTDMLYQYDVPIIFNCPSGNFSDIQTLIHEFGHFYNALRNSEHALTDPVNMDVAEIHSQGLELLCLDSMESIYQSDSTTIKLYVLYRLCLSVIDGCLYDEFQTALYQADDPLDLEKEQIDKLYCTLSKSYGYTYPDNTVTDATWTEIPHNFQSPMYYISYATSALSALDLLSIYQNDPNLGLQTYEDLITAGLKHPYCELISQMELRDIFTDGTISSICQFTQDYAANLYSMIHSETLIQKNYLLLFTAIVISLFLIFIVSMVRQKIKKAQNN